MLLLITREEKFEFIEESLVTRHFNSGVLEEREPWCLFSMLELYTTVLVAFHPGFQIKVPQMTIHIDLLQLKQLNSMEILLYFVFKTIKCDRSTWLARRKVDQSTPKSVRTLSVDRPLFRALCEWNLIFIPKNEH